MDNILKHVNSGIGRERQVERETVRGRYWETDGKKSERIRARESQTKILG